MAVARIITRIPEDAEALRRRLLQRGFAVEVVAPGAAPQPPAELEIHLERCPAEEALQRAQSFGWPKEADAQVFVAPGALQSQAEQAPEAAPAAMAPAAVARAAVDSAAAGPEPAPGAAATRREPRWGQALATAMGDAGQAFRWAGREISGRLMDALEAGSGWLARMGPRLKPTAPRWRSSAMRAGSTVHKAARARLARARVTGADMSAAAQRARHRGARRIREWHDATQQRLRAMGADWRAFAEARRAHREVWKERQAMLVWREVEARRKEETAARAQQAESPALHAAPLRVESQPAAPVARALVKRSRRAAAGAALVTLLAVVLWSELAGRRATEFLPPPETPQAGVRPAPFSSDVAVEVVPAAPLAGGDDGDRPEASARPAQQKAAPIPPPVIIRHEPEVVIRHLERPQPREPQTQQSQVKKITDMD